MLGTSVNLGTQALFNEFGTDLSRSWGVARLYESTGNMNNGAWTQVDWHRSKGRIAVVTLTIGNWVSGSWGGIASGSADAISKIDQLSAEIKLRAPWPVHLIFLHEPEDNITTSGAQTDYREAKRWAYNRLKVTNAVTNVIVHDCAYLPQTFRTKDWRLWSCAYNGGTAGTADNPNVADFYSTPGCDIVAFDVYNQHATQIAGWQTFQSQFDDCWTRTSKIFGVPSAKFPNVPYSVLEIGCAAYCGPLSAGALSTHTYSWSADNKAITEKWMDDALAHMKRRGVVIACWFNSSATGWRNLNYHNNPATGPTQDKTKNTSSWRWNRFRAWFDDPAHVMPGPVV